MNLPKDHEPECKPAVVVSLDFEMRWGMHDKLGMDKDSYRENIDNVRYIVPELLKMFSERGINATWACVGALGCKNWEEYFDRAPPPPNYENSALTVKREYTEMDPSGSLHFAPDLIRSIQATLGQELGTHTFSHIFMREPGVTEQDVRHDLAAVSDLWNEKFGGPPVSIVFPRNQYAYLDVISSTGIRIWRGNQSAWYFNCYESGNNTMLPRAIRLIDDLNPFVKRSYPHQPGITQASLFVRYDLNHLAWQLHYTRIKYELEILQAGHVFHLWWHPHNLGADMKNRLSRLERILDLIAEKMIAGRLVSKNMKELL